MKEKLYTIPVNDAFKEDCECPICSMKQLLETNGIEYVMGPSYMEDDVRMETDKLGFCKKHMSQLLQQKNKLGLAMILHTHMKKVTKEVEELSKKSSNKKGFFSKKTEETPIVSYIKKVESSCFLCNRINHTFERYLVTVVQLWKTDKEFQERYQYSKGFCMEHFGALLEVAHKELHGKTLEQFCEITTKLYLENMNRVMDDLEWFIDKFDYRNADKPWKNSKDAISRSALKINSIPKE